MPSKFTLILLVIVIIGLWATYTLLNHKPGIGGLAMPSFQQTANSSPTPMPTPETPTYNPPKDYQFDSSTNLQDQLDSVNPTVMDSDFTDLKSLQKSF